MAAGAVFAFLAEERRVVDGEEHTHGRLVDGDGGQRFGGLEVADGVADFKVLQADYGADVAALYRFYLAASHALKSLYFLDFGAFGGAVAVSDGAVHALADDTAVYAAHGNTARVVGVVERGDEHLRRTLQLVGCGNDFDDFVEQIVDVVRRLLPVFTHPVVLGRTVNHREVELLLGSVQVAHEVEHHFVHLFGAAVGFVHLVDHHDGFQSDLQGFLQHEARLWHRAFKSVNQQQASVGHVQHAFYLTAKVGVSRGVDDVDFDVFVVDGNVFRKDRDSAFALQVVVIQHEVVCFLIGSE